MNGTDSVRNELQFGVGKTIASIGLEPKPSKHPDAHHDEQLTIRFSDGSSLEIAIGSNGGNLSRQNPATNAADLSLSFDVIAKPARRG